MLLTSCYKGTRMPLTVQYTGPPGGHWRQPA
jgi:hypothetical protein